MLLRLPSICLEHGFAKNRPQKNKIKEKNRYGKQLCWECSHTKSTNSQDSSPSLEMGSYNPKKKKEKGRRYYQINLFIFEELSKRIETNQKRKVTFFCCSKDKFNFKLRFNTPNHG